jgi:DNA-binding transcriptional ArsR family regulator
MSKQTAKSAHSIDPKHSAAMFAALGDETRLRLLVRLRTGQSQSITQLAIGLPVTRQAVTKHLRVLEQAKLVSAQHCGRERKFVARSSGLVEAQAALQAISQQWDDLLERLKSHVERQLDD